METSEQQPTESVTRTVKLWSSKIKKAREKWHKDFLRMRGNMEFVAGLQWRGQESIEEEDRYVANLSLRMLNQKKSALYCRDPKATALRRKRLDFALWDGKVETLISCLQRAEMSGGQDVESVAILHDYMQGSQRREIVDRICKTLELVYQWNLDEQQPAYKGQMKDLVGRVITCGVGYVRVNFARSFENRLSSSEVNDSTIDRVKRAKMLMDKKEDESLGDDAPENETLKLLMNTIGSSSEEYQDVNERLIFDFPPATSIIPDPRTRSLRGFVGARWLVQEFLLPLEDVNSFFGKDIKSGTEVQEYQESGIPVESKAGGNEERAESPIVCVWELFDLNTKTHCFLLDGHSDYLQAPELVEPSTKHFWPIVALSFNQVEVEVGQKVSPFPPSDIDLIKSPQKEWNRTREALREHRKANAPKYLTTADLTDKDKENIECAAPHSAIKLQGIPAGSDPSKVFVPISMPQINPTMYDTSPLQEDVLQAAGMQEANLGPISGKGTATASTIAEQSRLTTASSNVDDIDDFLTELAQMSGEMLMKECSEETVKRIAGIGAVWVPQQNTEDFVNEIYLEIQAASSGRPNKAMEIANFERVAPTLLQSGANPQAVIREALRRLDDRAEVQDFYPVGLPAMAGPAQQPQQPLQQLPSSAPVPLAAA